MERKNKFIFVAVFVLLGINLTLFFLPEKKDSVSFDENMFAISDTTSISQVCLLSDDAKVEMSRTENGWELNGRFSVDEGLRRLVFSIMQQVRVKKPISELHEQGVDVKIGDLNFKVSGNATKTKTYFTQEGRSYEVEIPGYKDYLASIFELNADQWRDRLAYNGSWRTIQRLKLDYLSSEEDDFEINFLEQFFGVEGVTPIDSTFVIDYLNQFQYLQANERISRGRFFRYDSLSATEPMVLLTIESINYSSEEQFSIYPSIASEAFHLIKSKGGEMMIFDQKRVRNLLVKREDFKLKE